MMTDNRELDAIRRIVLDMLDPENRAKFTTDDAWGKAGFEAAGGALRLAKAESKRANSRIDTGSRD